jgi:hypothetical protein
MKRLAMLLLVACDSSPAVHDAPMRDARPDVAPIYECNCDPLFQTGCPGADGKCGWAYEPNDQTHGHIACGPIGSAALGEPCTYATTVSDDPSCGVRVVDNCVKGAACSDGICKAICDNLGGNPMCDAQHACVADPALFSTGSDTPHAAGVCDPM